MIRSAPHRSPPHRGAPHPSAPRSLLRGALLASLGLGFTAPVAAAELKFEQYTLENGMNVILMPDHSLPQVVVNLWYGVGAKDEVVGRTGFAHLFEHLMFMGTTRLPDAGFDEKMEAVGGWNNAWTSEDATDYFDVGPAHILPLFLWMEADRMDGLDSAMNEEKLAKQREVVRNERRQSYEDAPYGEAWLILPEVMYPPGHPYAHSVIGSHADLEAAKAADVVEFFNRWYVPNNASLVVAGDFEPAAARAQIAETFGLLKAKPLPERAAPTTPTVPQRALTEVTDQVDLPKTHLLWHSPAALSAGDAPMEFLAAILAEGRASRLHRRLVQDQRIATEVSAAQYGSLFSGLFIIEAVPAEGHTVDELEAAITEELQRIAAEGPTPDELQRNQNQVELDMLQSLEPLQGRASALNRYRYHVGRPDYIDAHLAAYRGVDAAAVKAAAAALTVERRAIIRVRPEPTGGEK